MGETSDKPSGVWRLGEIVTLGRQSGEYSPPALCFALTAINSAISLVDGRVQGSGDYGKVGVFGGEREGTYCCSARRSSRSFPTSWRRIRTSLASALLKSFRYLQDRIGWMRDGRGKILVLGQF